MGRTIRLAVALVLGMVLLWSSPAAGQDLYDCPDFTYQEDAQAVYDQDTSDPHGLDGPIGPTSSGIPGKACEDLPSRPAGAATSTTTTAPTATTATTSTPTTQAPTTTRARTMANTGSETLPLAPRRRVGSAVRCVAPRRGVPPPAPPSRGRPLEQRLDPRPLGR